MRMKRIAPALVLVAVTGVALSGCAEIQKNEAIDTERELAASGFQMKFAKTPAQIAKVAALPQRQLARVAGPDGAPRFVWADATDCRCIYAGNEAAYDRFQEISISQQIANEDEMTAAMDWNAFGPWAPWY